MMAIDEKELAGAAGRQELIGTAGGWRAPGRSAGVAPLACESVTPHDLDIEAKAFLQLLPLLSFSPPSPSSSTIPPAVPSPNFQLPARLSLDPAPSTCPDQHLSRSLTPTPLPNMSKANNKPKVAPSTHLIAGGIAGFAEACTCHRE